MPQVAPEMAREVLRLVKGSKSPTREKGGREFDLLADGGEIVGKIVNKYRVADVKSAGTVARLSFREWSNEWRIACRCETIRHSDPPGQAGDRITSVLSQRGARAIAESCDYVYQTMGGYRTFLTLTLDDEARQRVEELPRYHRINKKTPRVIHGTAGKKGLLVMEGVKADGEFRWVRFNDELELCERPAGGFVGGERAAGVYCPLELKHVTSIQREASRFFDAINKMHSRGWIPDYTRGRVSKSSDGADYTPINFNVAGEYLPGSMPTDNPLPYLWVAENPMTKPDYEKGPCQPARRNPHIHVLMRWQVPYSLFPCWAKRIERLWGQGFAHLEKLRRAESSAYYIAKAAGYLTKGNGESDQGPIRGNRYGMAQCARAPGFEPVLSWAWGVLASIMEEAKEIWKQQITPLRLTRKILSDKLDDIKKDGTENAKKKQASNLSMAILKLRKKITNFPAWFGRFNATFRGEEPLDKFVSWAQKRGWSMDGRPPSRWFHEWRRREEERKQKRMMRLKAHWEIGEWLSLVDQYNGWELVSEY